MSKIAVASPASGTATYTISAPAGSTDRTISLPDSNGTILTTATAGVPVNGPAFSAYLGTTQSFSANTWTKTTLQTEEFDTNNNYDNSTNYRFQPTVAGYYQVNANLCFSFTGSSSVNGLSIVKNGANPFDATVYATTASGTTINTSKLAYLNGSTDYIELYMYVGSVTSPFLSGPSVRNFFQAFLARSAT